MFALRSILCPIDFSPQSREALRWAYALARQQHSRLVVLTALDPLLANTARIRLHLDVKESETKPALTDFIESTLSRSTDATPDISPEVYEGDAPQVILEAAAREVDLVVMGTQGLGGVQKWLLGSTTERVLRRTKVPVLCVPPRTNGASNLVEDGSRIRLHRVFIGTDFSEASATAIRWAVDLAQVFDVPLLLAHAVTPLAVPERWQSYVPDIDEERTRLADGRLKAAAASYRRVVNIETAIAIGPPAEMLVTMAEERQAGLIVLGLMGDDGHVSRPGSIAYRLLCLTPVPVLVVPPSALNSRSPQA